MIWIVSKNSVQSEDDLKNRRQYIIDITQTEVSSWKESECDSGRSIKPNVKFYQCTSKKSEYGVVITAHINEVQPILDKVLSTKKALVVINSCAINKQTQVDINTLVKKKNLYSELLFAKQEKKVTSIGLYDLNYVDDVGTFGFGTTQSERELFQQRKLGLTKAIRFVFEKVME